MPTPWFKNAANVARISTLILPLALLVSSCSAGVAHWIPPSASDQMVSAQAVDQSSLLSAQPVAALAGLKLPAPDDPNAKERASERDERKQATPSIAPGAAQATEMVTVLPQAGQDKAAAPTAVRPDEPDEPIDGSGLTAVPETVKYQGDSILYNAQAADTLQAVAVRFGVDPAEILSDGAIPESAYFTPGQLLVIPRRLAQTTSGQHLIPDSEVVFAPSVAGFDPVTYAQQVGGRLGTERVYLKSTGSVPAPEVVLRVAIENSINPRLLLALLEYQSGWVLGNTQSQDEIDYPMGLEDLGKKGLYNQLRWAIDQLSIGYYGYREGRMTEIQFKDGSTARLAPELNAGTAALLYLFSKVYKGQDWLDALNPETGFPALYARMFGDPWQRASQVEPLFPAGTQQPALILPFERGLTWSFTGGPHGAWDSDGAYAALDFAPGGKGPGCRKSYAWTVAAAAGLVVRSGNGIVVLDLDGDGREETGWVLTYLHVASDQAVPAGTWVSAGDPLGHPSCEGGFSTGTHVHIARKFNGEWIPAGGPLPFNLGGWIAQAGEAAYQGTLTRDGETLKACTCSSAQTFITRTETDP